MQTYTVQRGDTKSSLQRRFGIAINDKQFRSSDPNKLFAGEVINIPAKKPVNSVPSVVKKDGVDLSRVKENKRPIQDVSLTPDNVETNRRVDNGDLPENQRENVPQFADVNLSPEEKLSNDADRLNADIEELEANIANKQSNRTEALDDAGVFEDMRKLNELKEELRIAQDRAIEIPIEERQKLRGKQATKTEFNQATRPQLENAALAELTASRAVSSVTDAINTNIQIIDQKLDAEFERDKFIYESKIKQLERVEKAHADIITNKQKIALEDRKFEQQLILESLKSENTLRNDLLKNLAEKGVGGMKLQSLANGSVEDILGFEFEYTAPSNWEDMTPQEAFQTLGKDGFDDWQKDREWRKNATDEEKQAMNEARSVTMGAKSIIDTVETMLNDKGGLKASVGETFFGRRDASIPFTPFGKETAQFRAQAKKLTAQKTLDQLIQMKQSGATLGAISEKELEILSNAALALGTEYDDQGKPTGRFNMDEESFMEELKTIRLASMKIYVAGSMGTEAYARAGLQEADFETIEPLYQDVRVNGYQNEIQDFAEDELNSENLEQAFNLITEEEGLRTDAYQDSTGTWTIGFGTTTINGRPVQPGDRLSTEQAKSIMQDQVVTKYTSFVDDVQRDITPNQFAALTSFEYNLGPGVWQSTTGRQILSYLNEGNAFKAGQLMQLYNKSRNPQTGQLEVNPVLARRRAREGSLLLT